MFGGVGLYCDGVFFGLIALDVLYLKVDATTRSDYESAGSLPFRPVPRSRRHRCSTTPCPVGRRSRAKLELVEWARKAVTVARRVAQL